MTIKNNQIFKLLRRFSIILIVLMCVLSILLLRFYYIRNEDRARQNTAVMNQNLASLVEDHWETTQQESFQLVETTDNINALFNYFELSYADNLEKSLSQAESLRDFYYLPQTLFEFYGKYPHLASVTIVLNEYQDILYSNIPKNMYGKKTNTLEATDHISYSTNINTPFSYEVIGLLKMAFKVDHYDTAFASLESEFPLHALILDGNDQIIYVNDNQENIDPSYSEQVLSVLRTGEGLDDFIIRERRIGDHRILVSIPKSSILKTTIENSAFFILLIALIVMTLLIVLYVMFNNYIRQLKDILVTSQMISDGNKDARIDVSDKTGEMKDISQSINELVESVQLYTKDIYDLEIRQRDAQMSTLQAQINPHFFYNTLEYIRMSALTEGAEELAEVIFAFGSLLRNNITLEKMVPLHSELEFCEKYIYLYQMRYPSNIAYSFDIANDVKDLAIPKFTLQPIIENYFAHGIDFTRINNVIKVTAYQTDEEAVIEIKDNGNGMAPEDYQVINEAIRNHEEPSKDAVGILNVSQRLYYTFDTKVEMEYTPTYENNGVTVTIRIKKED